MKQQFNHHFIKTFHRRLRLPRKFVYSAANGINATFFQNAHEKNEIKIHSNNMPGSTIRHDLGYHIFTLNDEDILKNVVIECQAIFDRNSQKYDDQYFIINPSKKFLLTIDSDENLLENKYIKKFVNSDFVNNKVSNYLNQPYVLSALRLWWTPTNNTSISSQKFHLDEEDTTQIKVFLNVSDVTDHHGPFTFLPHQPSYKVLSYYKNGKRRFTDDEIHRIIKNDEIISLTGISGDGAFIDTSKCLHFGSRNNTKERLVLMAQFLKSNAPLITKSLHL